MDILFKGVTAVTMNGADGGVIKNAYVGVKDGKISYVGTEEPLEAAKEVINGKGKVLIPGLINTHTHLPMSFLRGYSDDCPLHIWLNDFIFPAEARLDDRAVRAAALMGMAEAVSFGSTSFTEMYGHLDMVFEAAEEMGIKLNGSNGSVYFGAADDFDFEKCSDMTNMRAMHEKWHGRDNSRLRFEGSVHAEYTSSHPLWEAVAEYAINNGLQVNVHLSETKKEHEECLERHGLTPAQVFDCHGLWKAKATAAHCVWLSDEDIELLAKRGVSAAHNAISNQKLGSGTARVKKMLSKGMNVALGTDSVASNNNLDMFEEMKAAAIAAKNLETDPTVLGALDVFTMATVNGAIAQGRQDECGRIAVGYDADLALVDFDKPHLFPCHNVISSLVYAAKGSDVVMTMVRGKTLYKNGEFLCFDWEKAKYEMEHYVMPLIFG